jgi:hypothetical protein
MKLDMPVGISKAEQETSIGWDEDQKAVVIWSASPVVLRRLHKLGLLPASESRRRTGELHGREYRLPLARFRWGLKRRGIAREGAFLPRTARQEASLSTERGSDVVPGTGGRTDAL